MGGGNTVGGGANGKAKVEVKKIKSTPKRTSIGKSRRSRPLNKNKKKKLEKI